MRSPLEGRRHALKLLAGAASAACLPGRALAKDPPPRPTLELVAEGLRFPEGPVALADGSLVVSEVAAGRLTRIAPDGTQHTLAAPGGGPNGNAMGPDGAIYSCNNGGFSWSERDGVLIPGHRAADYAGGRIDRIDPASGEVKTLYREAGGRRLGAPNDLCFDDTGHFWFTDFGSTGDQGRDHGAILFAAADGSHIRRVVDGLIGPNGIALSPDGDVLYVALTYERQVLAFDVRGPGVLEPAGPLPGRVLCSLPDRNYLDSMRVEAGGNLCVGNLLAAGIRVISPAGEVLGLVEVPDLIPANLCFGGEDLRTAYLLASTTGRVFRTRWPRPGHRLPFSG